HCLTFLIKKIEKEGIMGEPWIEDTNKISWRTNNGKSKRSFSWKKKDFQGYQADYIGECLSKIATEFAKKRHKWNAPNRLRQRPWKYDIQTSRYVKQCLALLRGIEGVNEDK